MALVASLTLAGTTRAEASEEVPSAEQLERAAVDCRRHSIRNGRVRLHYLPERLGRDSERPDKERRLKRNQAFEYEIVFDEDKLHFGRSGWNAAGDQQGYVQRTILSGDKCISDARRDLVVHVTNRNIDLNVDDRFQPVHPRDLGMSVNPPYRLYLDGLRGLLGRNDRTATAVTPDRVDGVPAWRIDYEVDIPAGSPVTACTASVWIAPSQGNGVLRAVERYVTERGIEANEVRSKLKRYPEGDLWYPVETVTTATLGETLANRDTVTVKEARFDIDVDPDQFTLSGLNLKIGRVIIDESEGPARRLIWDGSRAVGISAEQVRVKEQAASTAPRYTEPISLPWDGVRKYGTATLLAGAAIGFGWYGLRRRQAG